MAITVSEQQAGGIQLERTVESIQVGRRHRTDLGDLDALAASIARDGLLQPPTLTPDGVLVCGARRLAAIKQLGWRTVNVWVRSGISDRLGHLLAEQDDNTLHKPLTSLEAAALYRELKALMAEDAARRDAATRFSSTYQPGSDGAGNFPAPLDTPRGEARAQAAAMIPGGASYKTLEKVGYLERLAAGAATPAPLREQASAGLERIEAGAPVHPIYQALRDAVAIAQDDRNADLDRRAREAVARAKATHATTKKHTTPAGPGPNAGELEAPRRYPVRAFLATWSELDGWWLHYDSDVLAAELTDQQIEDFLGTVEGTVTFADRLRITHQPTIHHASNAETEDGDGEAQRAGDRPRLRAL